MVARSAVADLMLAIKADSTVELPSEPDPGSVGSSSCVSITSERMGVCIEVGEFEQSSNFDTAAPVGSAVCDQL